MAWADETTAVKAVKNAIFFNIIGENGVIFGNCKFIMTNSEKRFQPFSYIIFADCKFIMTNSEKPAFYKNFKILPRRFLCVGRIYI